MGPSWRLAKSSGLGVPQTSVGSPAPPGPVVKIWADLSMTLSLHFLLYKVKNYA